jgi:hypothetical protein
MAGFNGRIVNGLQAFHDLGNGVDMILVAGIIDDYNPIGRDLETLQLRNGHRDIVTGVGGRPVGRRCKISGHPLITGVSAHPVGIHTVELVQGMFIEKVDTF